MSRTARLDAGGADANVPSASEAQAGSEYPPIIYTRVVSPPRLSWSGRGFAFAVATGCLAVLLTAAGLSPSHHGIGTHTQLGLRSCAFKTSTGLPCPSCGMTTSFAYFAHGNLPASFYTQPMGALLAILAAAAVWVGFYIAFTGRPVHRLLRFLPYSRWLIPMLVFALAAWGWKIVLTLEGLDGWK